VLDDEPHQRELLLMRAAPLCRQSTAESSGAFDNALAKHGVGALTRGRVTTLQLNVGKLCNMACHHCHVEAGPKRTEIMGAAVAERVLAILRYTPEIDTLDLTGGAPELNPHFRALVVDATRLGRRVVDRCNLTVFFEAGMDGLPEFLADNRVHVVASLPCYEPANVDKQRGHGAFEKSIAALRRLNALGYGRLGTGRRLSLVYNPLGATLPPSQALLEQRYKEELSRLFDVVFDDLLTITNMPIKRFAEQLARAGNGDAYMSLLANHFNVETISRLMCRSLVSVGWDGAIYDCDFNQMLELPLGAGARTIWDVERLDTLDGAPIATGPHCFGCTAGAGSSCSGALT
jgi:radical SAM/Cys-rich protein